MPVRKTMLDARSRKLGWWRGVAGGLLTLALVAGCGHTGQPADDQAQAIAAAQQLFRRDKAAGLDMSPGPCIAQEIIPDWAADVAHNPRQPVDDLPQNQCASVRQGTVHNFVELDPDGNVIRAQ